MGSAAYRNALSCSTRSTLNHVLAAQRPSDERPAATGARRELTVSPRVRSIALILIQASSSAYPGGYAGCANNPKRRRPDEILHEPAQVLLRDRSAHALHVRLHPGQ